MCSYHQALSIEDSLWRSWISRFSVPSSTSSLVSPNRPRKSSTCCVILADSMVTGAAVVVVVVVVLQVFSSEIVVHIFQWIKHNTQNKNRDSLLISCKMKSAKSSKSESGIPKLPRNSLISSNWNSSAVSVVSSINWVVSSWAAWVVSSWGTVVISTGQSGSNIIK